MKFYYLTYSLGLVLFVLAVTLVSSGNTMAATVPTGFTDSLVANGLTNPTAMALAPDGRIFVCEQGGKLRVIKNGALLATPFVTLTVDSAGERGLLGVTFDPNFVSNQLVYVYYTVPTPAHNRVSRFIANGDVALAGSETILMELPNLSTATNHNAGAIHFGPDGDLYVAVGDNANGNNAQSFSTVLGKMLRITSSGAIPGDNPFFDTTTGINRSIWALGLRNPFTFAFQPGTGRMFINNVGLSTWEEINDGMAGANYGWPICEGFCNPPDPDFTDPIFIYENTGTQCAITGGSFYNPDTVQFPTEFVGSYFFADFCGGWIHRLDLTNGVTVSDFATGIANPVDLKVSDDGFLYYLARTSGAVGRIAFTGGGGGGGGDTIAPTVSITNPANGATVPRRTTITITATASDNVGVTRVEFLVEGNLQCTDTSAPYSCNWRVPNTPNKSYQLSARAFDAAGNAGMASIQVTAR